MNTYRIYSLTELNAAFKNVAFGQEFHFIKGGTSERGQSYLSFAISLKANKIAHAILSRLNRETARLILQNFDEGGYTALHHAALYEEDQTIYKKLKRLIGATFLAEENYANSASFLHKISGLCQKHLCNEKFFLKGIVSDRCVKLPSYQFFPKNIVFSYFSHGDVETLKRMWENEEEMIDYDPNLKPAYMKFCDKLIGKRCLSKVAYKKIERDDEGNPVQVGHGLVAVKPIRKNEIICEYGGRYQYTFEPYNSTYAFSLDDIHEGLDLNAADLRGIGAVANHSFPNATIEHVQLPGRKILVLVARKDIEPNEEICISYFFSYFTSLLPMPVELRPKALKEFIAKNPLTIYFKLLNEKTFNENNATIIEQWNYLLRDSPVYVVYWILKGVIPLKEGKYLYRNLKLNLNSKLKSILFHTYFVHKIPLDVLHFSLKLRQNDPPLAEKVAAKLCRNSYTLPQIKSLQE